MRKELVPFCKEVTKELMTAAPFYVVLSGTQGSGKSLVGCEAQYCWCICAVLSHAPRDTQIRDRACCSFTMCVRDSNQAAPFVGGAKSG